MPTIPYKNAAGKRIPGVTTVIGGNLGWSKDALMWWAWNEGMEGRHFRETSQHAADAGTVGHYLIDCWIHGSAPDISQHPADVISKAETCLSNFRQWMAMFQLNVRATEVHLVSEKFQYGATPDCIGTLEGPGDSTGKLALIDWKTGSGVYPDMLIQLAAYRQAWEENNPTELIEGGFHLLRIGKEDASFHHHHWADLPEAWVAFTHCLELHKLRKRLKSLT